MNFRLPTCTTTVVTRNNLKDGPQIDGDIWIPDSLEEEDATATATATCKTAEQCNCIFLIYQVYLLMCN